MNLLVTTHEWLCKDESRTCCVAGLFGGVAASIALKPADIENCRSSPDRGKRFPTVMIKSLCSGVPEPSSSAI